MMKLISPNENDEMNKVDSQNLRVQRFESAKKSSNFSYLPVVDPINSGSFRVSSASSTSISRSLPRLQINDGSRTNLNCNSKSSPYLILPSISSRFVQFIIINLWRGMNINSLIFQHNNTLTSSTWFQSCGSSRKEPHIRTEQHRSSCDCTYWQETEQVRVYGVFFGC